MVETLACTTDAGEEGEVIAGEVEDSSGSGVEKQDTHTVVPPWTSLIAEKNCRNSCKPQGLTNTAALWIRLGSEHARLSGALYIAAHDDATIKHHGFAPEARFRRRR